VTRDEQGRIGHRLFDRVVWTREPLRLLPEGGAPSPVPGDVVLEWVDEPAEVSPEAPFVSGKMGDFCRRRTATGLAIDLRSSRIRVLCDPTGTRLSIHPLEPTQPRLTGGADPGQVVEPPKSTGIRLAIDGLVTRLLCRLPALWGHVPLHSAALGSPAGLVLISGTSGAGKSTLSQYLARDHGWTLYDDDTNALVPDGPGMRIVPMGASGRLRADAAAGLGVTGEALPAYVGDKIAVGAATPEALRALPAHIVAVVHLIRVPDSRPLPDNSGSKIHVKPLRGPEALMMASRSTMPIDPRAPEWLALRMAVCARLAEAPTVIMASRMQDVTAREMAGQVAQLVSDSPPHPRTVTLGGG
jgi:hypothetical protein